MTGVVSRTIYTRFYDARAQPRCGPLQTHLSTSGTFINRSSRIVLPSIPLAGTSLLFSIIFLANDIPPPANLPRKLWCKTLFRFLPIKKKCLARVILSQNNLLLPPTQFDSNCKHRRHYFDSYLNLHFTWQTKIKQWNNSFNRGNFLLWIDFDWQDLDFLMEYLQSTFYNSLYKYTFLQFLFRVFFWYGEFSCIENCSKSPWEINGGNIKKRSVWWIKWMRKFVKTDVKFWITREREKKGLLTSVQFLNEVMRGIKEEGWTRKGACGLNIKGAK